MYTIHYTSDIIRGKNNLGDSISFENLSEDGVKNRISEFNNNFGKPSSVTKSHIMWLNDRDTYCFFIYKDYLPVSDIESFV